MQLKYYALKYKESIVDIIKELSLFEGDLILPFSEINKKRMQTLMYTIINTHQVDPMDIKLIVLQEVEECN